MPGVVVILSVIALLLFVVSLVPTVSERPLVAVAGILLAIALILVGGGH